MDDATSSPAFSPVRIFPSKLWAEGVYKEKTNPDKLTEPKRIGFI